MRKREKTRGETLARSPWAPDGTQTWEGAQKGSMKKSVSRDKDEADGRSAERPKEGSSRGLEKGRVRAVVDRRRLGRRGRPPPEGRRSRGERDQRQGQEGEQPEAANKAAAPEKAKGLRTGEDTRGRRPGAEGGPRGDKATPGRRARKARKEEPHTR